MGNERETHGQHRLAWHHLAMCGLSVLGLNTYVLNQAKNQFLSVMSMWRVLTSHVHLVAIPRGCAAYGKFYH